MARNTVNAVADALDGPAGWAIAIGALVLAVYVVNNIIVGDVNGVKDSLTIGPQNGQSWSDYLFGSS